MKNDLNVRYTFQTLFYCGLHNSELKGLTWKDINFNKHTLTVNKNIVKVPNESAGKPYTIVSPKTMSNYITFPIPNFLISDVEELYDRGSTYYIFTDA